MKKARPSYMNVAASIRGLFWSYPGVVSRTSCGRGLRGMCSTVCGQPGVTCTTMDIVFASRGVIKYLTGLWG